MKKIALFLTIIAIANLISAQKSHSDILDVKSYTINLDITDIDGEYIEGYASLILSPIQENTDIFILDLQNLVVDSITCDQSELDGFTYNDTIITIDLADSFNPEDEITINVYYHGNPQEDPSGWGGFYFMSGYAFNLGVGFEDVPHNYGRVWFPCNDDFVDKAVYTLNITTQIEHTAVCGGELISTIIDEPEQTATYTWVLDKEVPTYLVSVAVGSYIKISHTYHGIEADIPVEFYIYPGDSARTAQSFVNIDSVLRIYETKFGAYPWNRVGYVSVPFNSGAMEHVTNIAMGRDFVDGTLYFEDLFYHELAHMWFGDYITCSSAEDMWINEGWATYCETVYMQYLYDEQTAKDFRRSSHETVLRYYHIQDGGFHALYPMDQSLTYSRTVYEKGASVAHALRGYLGDDIFFETMTNFLQENEYSSVSSYDMRDFISDYTGIDMTDFFEDWVFTPGFVHYSIDSTTVEQFGSDYEITVYMQQKLRGRETFANSNKVEISFMRSDYSVQTETIEFDGQFGQQTYTLDFNPGLTLCDYNERTSDATIDESKFLQSTGITFYNGTYFSVDVQSLNENDSTFFRVTHNWAAPDAFKTEIPGLVLADHRFWTIESIQNGDFKSKGRFNYNKTANSAGYLDTDFITNSLDSLVLVYRPNKAADWIIEDATHSTIVKRITVDSIKNGEYSLAIWDWDRYLDIQNHEVIASMADIYPNPNSGIFNLKIHDNFTGSASVINSSGSVVYQKNNLDIHSEISFDLNYLPDGLYFVKLIDEKTNSVIIKKFIIQK
ncbi:MAG: T9SS type A sorting domain-containing protein [Bacteroidales bacterium]|nr:T9SS type A sorting domain-containing protein [Bacteroidales bacterium]